MFFFKVFIIQVNKWLPDLLTDSSTERQMDGQTDRQTERQTDIYTDRQEDIYLNSHGAILLNLQHVHCYRKSLLLSDECYASLAKNRVNVICLSFEQ